MELTAPNLENDQVRLEPLGEEHRDALRATEAVEYMWRSMPVIQRGAGFDAYFDYMIRCGKSGDALPFAIICKPSNQFVGWT